MKIFSIFILFFCSATLVFAQSPIEQLDSKQINDLAWAIRKEYPDSTIYYALKAQELATIEGNQHQRLRAINFIGIAYSYKGENAKSLEQHLKAKDLSLVLNDSIEYGHSLNSIGRLYFGYGDYIKAYEMYFNALRIFLDIDDQLGAAYCYNSLSELYIAQNNLSKAEEMVRMTIDIRTSMNDTKGRISALIELAKIQKTNKAYIDSYESYLIAEELALSENSTIEVAEIKLGIADLYLQQKNHDRGLFYATDAIKLANTKNNIDLISRAKSTLGKLHFMAGNYNNAQRNLLEVLEYVEKSSDLELKTDAYFYLSKIKENQGIVKEAYELFKLYNEAKSALDNSSNARMIERLEGKIEIEKREQENEALRIRQLKDQAVIERQFILNVAASIGFVLISLLVIILFISIRRRKRDNLKLARKNQQIARQNESLAELNNEKDMLMNIVAHDLQSPINNIQSLIGIIGTEGPLNKNQKNYAQKIDKILNASKELIQDLLYVSDFEGSTHQLSLSMVDIDSLANKIGENYRLHATSKQIALRFDLNCEGYALETDQSYLSHILDNLISNAVKFSPRSKSVYISTFISEDKACILKIRDEGQGFSDKDKEHLYKKFKKLSARPTGGESSNGLGLAIVKILCSRLDIEIELESNAGQGSEFTLKFKTKKTLQ